MDGWDALPGLAPDGRQRLDQIAVGGERKRAQTEILFDQEGWQANPGRAAPAVADGPLGVSRTVEGATCLISIERSRNGGANWVPARSRPRNCSMNWKAICATISRSRCGPVLKRSPLSRLRWPELAR